MAEGGGRFLSPKVSLRQSNNKIPNNPGEAPRPGELAKWVGEKTTQVLNVLR